MLVDRKRACFQGRALKVNFFALQLNDYFLEGGKQLPPEVLAVLGKPLKGLNASEIEVYNRFIGPTRTRSGPPCWKGSSGRAARCGNGRSR